MNMKTTILTIIFCLSAFSCAINKKEVIKRSTIKIEEISANIRNLIEIEGYYTVQNNPNWGSYMFFEDGSFVYFHFKSGISDYEKQTNMSKAIEIWKSKKQVQWGTNWGVYSIQNDTIIVNSYDKPAFFKPMAINEMRYKIIDRNTIQRVYFRVNSKAADDYYKTNSPWIDEEPMYFTPADSLPSSDSWLKEEKWIWQNEQDWKEYMQKIKKK